MSPAHDLPPWNSILPIRNLVSNLPPQVLQVYYRDLGTFGSFLALEYETFFYALWSPEKTFPPTREHVERIIRRGWSLPVPMAFDLFRRSTFGKPYVILRVPADFERIPGPDEMHTSTPPASRIGADPVT